MCFISTMRLPDISNTVFCFYLDRNSWLLRLLSAHLNYVLSCGENSGVNNKHKNQNKSFLKCCCLSCLRIALGIYVANVTTWLSGVRELWHWCQPLLWIITFAPHRQKNGRILCLAKHAEYKCNHRLQLHFPCLWGDCLLFSQVLL